MWKHIRQDLLDAAWAANDAGLFLRSAAKAALAAIFGRVTHGGVAVTFRGTSYWIDRHTKKRSE